MICLGNSWTARRYPMTVQRHWPEVTKLLLQSTVSNAVALWHTHPEFRRRVFSEWDKIEPYRAQGFIAESPVSET